MPVPTTAAAAPTGAVQSEAITIGTRTASARLPDLEIQPPFLYFHNPASWYVAEGDDGPELLPLLSQIPIEPGVALTDKNGDPSLMIGRKQNRGWTMIPETAATAADTPDGRPGYVRRTTARRGPTHYPAWQSWRTVAGRPVLGSDNAGYRTWLRSLMDRGIIAPPDPAVIEAKLDAARERLGRAEQRDAKPGSTAALLVDRARANVEALTHLAGASDTVERAVADAAPKPRRGRPPKAAPEASA